MNLIEGKLYKIYFEPKTLNNEKIWQIYEYQGKTGNGPLPPRCYFTRTRKCMPKYTPAMLKDMFRAGLRVDGHIFLHRVLKIVPLLEHGLLEFKRYED